MNRAFSESFYSDEEISFGLVEAAGRSKPLLKYPPACGVLPLEKDGSDTIIHLVEQYRAGPDALSIEIPAGKQKPNESPGQCAARELREEAGLQAGRLTELFRYYPAIGISTEVLVLYEASDLTQVESDPDDDEEFTLLQWSMRQLAEAIEEGRVRDGKTILAYYHWLARQK